MTEHRTSRRMIAFLMALLLCAQCADAAQAEDAGSEELTGKVLAAINTDYKLGEKSFRAHLLSGAEQNEAAVAAESDAPEYKDIYSYLWDQIEPMDPQQAAQAEAENGAVQAQRARAYKIGDTKTISGANVTAGLNFDSSKMSEALKKVAKALTTKSKLRCDYVGEYCTVWNEVDGKWSAEDCEKLGQFADAAIPQLLDLFGDRRVDTDGDGKFALFVYQFPEGSGMGGYFSPIDVIDRSGKIGDVRMSLTAVSYYILGLSTSCDCMHINAEFDDVEDLKTVFVHEYQHYIHLSYCYAGKTNETVIREDESYLNEAFSMAAQKLVYLTPGYADAFARRFRNADYARHSLVTWTQVFDGYEDSAVSYGMSYLFGQYIRTRYASLTGDTQGENPGKGIYKRVLESRTQENTDTLGIIADILYPQAAYPALADTDARIRELICDFWLAVYCKDAQGVRGFNGEEWANEYATQMIDGLPEGDTLRSAMAAFYVLNDGETDTAIVDECGEGMRFVALPGKQHTLTLDANDESGDTQTILWWNEIVPLSGDRLFRSGYRQTGWADAPDAQTQQWDVYGSVIVSGKKTVYAVWEPVEALTLNKSYTVKRTDDEEEGKYITAHYQFTPEKSGVYTLQIDGSDNPDISVTDAQCDPVEYDRCGNGCSLEGGQTYDVCVVVWLDAHAECTLTPGERRMYYPLHYCVGLPEDADASWTRNYNTTYSVEGCADLLFGYLFAGWATTKDAQTPEYVEGDTITLTAETTLYPVWTPCAELKAGKAYTLREQDTIVKFTTKKTGSYLFWAEHKKETETASGKDKYARLYIYDADGNYLFTCIYAQATYTLEGGKTYFVRFNDQTSKVSYRFVSSSTNQKLRLQTDYTETSVLLRGRSTYTIPANFRPYNCTASGGVLLYWVDEQTGEQYAPGDTITINRYTVLRAEFEPFDASGIDVGNVGKVILATYRHMIRDTLHAKWIMILNWLGLL